MKSHNMGRSSAIVRIEGKKKDKKIHKVTNYLLLLISKLILYKAVITTTM